MILGIGHLHFRCHPHCHQKKRRRVPGLPDLDSFDVPVPVLGLVLAAAAVLEVVLPGVALPGLRDHPGES